MSTRNQLEDEAVVEAAAPVSCQQAQTTKQAAASARRANLVVVAPDILSPPRLDVGHPDPGPAKSVRLLVLLSTTVSSLRNAHAVHRGGPVLRYDFERKPTSGDAMKARDRQQNAPAVSGTQHDSADNTPVP